VPPHENASKEYQAVKILFVASEAVPFAKTGGLADVCGALPGELAALGHEVALIMPAFRQIYRTGRTIEPLGVSIEVPIGTKTLRGELLKSRLDGDVPVYFVKQDDYFDRDGLYGDANGDYKDNCERFVFFNRAVMDAIRLLDLQVDVLHAHDWMAALSVAYLANEYRAVPGYEQMASLFTIHNLAYQGTFWHWDMLLTGLDWKYFNWRQMEFYGNLNLMKTGLTFADMLNTVSPRYAEEIQSAPLGCGLEGVLQYRRNVLKGIVNGVDYAAWNPETDGHLPVRYNVHNFAEGKAACKRALQQELGLPVRPEVPLFGFIGRLADQKGFDLIESVVGQWSDTVDVQWAFLGTGDLKYHRLMESVHQRHPDRVAAQLTFSEALAHRIEAGADMFLMPSRYEPCGLNQLYSLKYGTVPIVRATGGLADTITDVNDETLASGTATGFSFNDYTGQALSQTLHRAVATFRDKPDVWKQLVTTGMKQDWSWSRSARQYVDLYRQAVASRRQSPAAAGR
jgi:starch synthase